MSTPKPTRKLQFGDRIRVVPETGKIIRHEVTGQVLPPDGATAVYSSFWARRVSERSVIVDLELPELDPNLPSDPQPGELLPGFTAPGPGVTPIVDLEPAEPDTTTES